jgi:hypothetical protein
LRRAEIKVAMKHAALQSGDSVSAQVRAMGFALALFGAGFASSAQAQSGPDTENGRYTLSPVADGVLRLDSRTGSISICNNARQGWACYAVPDERAALDAEIGRLQRDNEKLKAQLAQRETGDAGKINEALPKSDALKETPPDQQRKLELTLPSDRDIDRAMSFLERAWRRLIEMADRVQRDVSGRI